jgi:hypothetical protein
VGIDEVSPDHGPLSGSEPEADDEEDGKDDV